jgi:hypothetical protein
MKYIMNQTYYINELSGNDINDGSILYPWKTFINIKNNMNIILLNNFTIELNLNNLNNINIQGDTFIPIPVVPSLIDITNINTVDDYRNTYKQNIITNPTKDQVGAPKSLNNEPIRNFTIQDRNYNTKVLSINLNNCNNININGISVSYSYNINNVNNVNNVNNINNINNAIIKKGIKLTSCNNCIINNCELFSYKDTTNWTKEDWNNNATGIVILYGKNNKIFNCNIYNCGGIQVSSVNNIISNNFITDFPTDGSGLWGNNNLFINNRVVNSKIVNTNHNDMLQSSVCINNCIINNVFIAYLDNKAPFYNTSVQGIGCFDGWYKNYLIKRNYVFVDHPIGIWLMGADNCIIDSNTLRVCGSVWNKRRSPCILLGPKKSGELSTNNIIINNIAPHFELQTDGGIFKNNYSLDTNTFI